MREIATRLVAVSLLAAGAQHALYLCGALGHGVAAAALERNVAVSRAESPEAQAPAHAPAHAACHHDRAASPGPAPSAPEPACCGSADAFLTLPAAREPTLARSASVPAAFPAFPAAAPKLDGRGPWLARAPIPGPGGTRFPHLRSHLAFATILV